MHPGSVRGRSRGVRIRGELSTRPVAPRGSAGVRAPGTVATFLTPSVDDLKEDLNTGLEYVSAAGTHKTFDPWGDQRLVPELAFTCNVGASLGRPRVRASLDYWNCDFESGSRPSRREGGSSRRGSSARHPEVGSGVPSPPGQARPTLHLSVSPRRDPSGRRSVVDDLPVPHPVHRFRYGRVAMAVQRPSPPAGVRAVRFRAAVPHRLQAAASGIPRLKRTSRLSVPA